eukprot:scaffold6494_cov109-Cylindrotheca_fusiformis.AAC.4
MASDFPCIFLVLGFGFAMSYPPRTAVLGLFFTIFHFFIDTCDYPIVLWTFLTVIERIGLRLVVDGAGVGGVYGTFIRHSPSRSSSSAVCLRSFVRFDYFLCVLLSLARMKEKKA